MSQTIAKKSEPQYVKPLHLREPSSAKGSRQPTLSKQELHNDKDFKRLKALTQQKDHALQHSTLTLKEKGDQTDAFISPIMAHLKSDPRYKNFIDSIQEKVNQIAQNTRTHLEFKKEMQDFTAQKHKKYFGEAAPFISHFISRPMHPSDIDSFLTINNHYSLDPKYRSNSIIARKSTQIVAEDGFKNGSTQGIKNISEDPRATELVKDISKEWNKIQKENISASLKKKKIATFSVKQTHKIFGNYDKLKTNLPTLYSKMSQSEKTFYRENKYRNMDLKDYKKGQFVCAQYSNITAYALQKAANIETTSLAFTFLTPNNSTAAHEALFVNDEDFMVETTNSDNPIRNLPKNKLKDILEQKTKILDFTIDDKDARKVTYHIFSPLTRREIEINSVGRDYHHPHSSNIQKQSNAEPQNRIRNIILNHLSDTKTMHRSSDDIEYIKFMYQTEKPFFNKVDRKLAQKVPTRTPYSIHFDFPFSHEF